MTWNKTDHHRMLGLVILIAGMLLGACTSVGGAPDVSDLFSRSGSGSGSRGSQPRSSQAQPRRSAPAALTASDLKDFYDLVLTSYVDPVQPVILVDGAVKGFHQGAVEAGLLPAHSVQVESISLLATNDPDTDWTPLASAYDGLLKKVGPRVLTPDIGDAMVRGMLEALDDPLTAYYDPQTVAARLARGTAGVVSRCPTSAAHRSSARSIPMAQPPGLACGLATSSRASMGRRRTTIR
jgi:hypothetical protein